MRKSTLLLFIFSLFTFHFSFTPAVLAEDTAIAEVSGSVITENEFTRYLDERPVSRSSESIKEGVNLRLEEMITAEVLYREAVRLKIDSIPEIRQTIRQIMAQKLLEEQVIRNVWERTISDDELQQYYDDHIDEFVRPEQARVADIFIAVPLDASPDFRAEKRTVAEQVLADVRMQKGRFAFGEAAVRYSDQPTGYSKGDTGYFNREGSPIELDGAIVDAAFQLSRNGEVYDKVIGTADGFHIIMLIGKQSAFKKELKSVAKQLEQRIRREEQKTKREEYIKSLRGKAEVQIDEKALEEIVSQINQSTGSRTSGGQGGRLKPPPLPGKKN